MAQKQKVSFDIIQVRQSGPIERNGASQLIFLNGGGVGGALINGALQQINFPFVEPVNFGEISNTQYNVVLTGTYFIIVIRKYYIDQD